MTQRPRILAIGAVDARGIAGIAMGTATHSSWEELGVPAPGNGRTYRALAGKPDQTFRRLDRATRALVLAAEACGISRLLTPDECEESALVVETSRGCIEADLRYARALDRGIVYASIFPYTLQSTCLGDVALRHGLRGPTLSLSIERGQEGEALREALRMATGDAVRHAVVGRLDVLDEHLPDATPVLRAVVCILAPPQFKSEAVADWPDEGCDPFETLADVCFGVCQAALENSDRGL